MPSQTGLKGAHLAPQRLSLERLCRRRRCLFSTGSDSGLFDSQPSN